MMPIPSRSHWIAAPVTKIAPFHHVRDVVAAEIPRHAGQEALGRRRVRGTEVHEHERAGAVRVLGHAGLEARLAEQRRLLITGDAAHGHVEPGGGRGCRHPEAPATGSDLGETRAWYAEERAQLVGPAVRVDVVQERAAGVRRVGRVHAAVGPAGEAPEDPAVDGAEREVRSAVDAALGEQPLQLGGGEVGVEDEPGPLADEGLDSLGPELVAPCGRPAVLPDDGAMQRPARAPVPHHCGFALVRDADRGDRMPGVGELGLHLGERLERRRPDVVRVVLDPPGLREMLRELTVGPADGGAVLVDRERAHARGAGIDRQADAHHSTTSDGRRGSPPSALTSSRPTLRSRGRNSSAISRSAESRIRTWRSGEKRLVFSSVNDE